jgi:hypothetical protein
MKTVRRAVLAAALVVLIIADVWAITQTLGAILLARLFAGIGHDGHAFTVVWFVWFAFFLGLAAGFVWLTVVVIKALCVGPRPN